MNPTSSCGDLTVTQEPVDSVVLSVGSGSTSLNNNGMIDIDMDNNQPVGGFQFTLEFDSSIMSVVEVNTTERTSNFTVSTANGVVVGFSLTEMLLLQVQDQF